MSPMQWKPSPRWLRRRTVQLVSRNHTIAYKHKLFWTRSYWFTVAAGNDIETKWLKTSDVQLGAFSQINYARDMVKLWSEIVQIAENHTSSQNVFYTYSAAAGNDMQTRSDWERFPLQLRNFTAMTFAGTRQGHDQPSHGSQNMTRLFETLTCIFHRRGKGCAKGQWLDR